MKTTMHGLVVGVLLLFGCGAEESPAAPAAPAAGSSGGIVCRAPVGEGADFSEFTWECELPPGGYFQVAVYEHNSGHPLGPRRRSRRLEEARWKPRSHDTRRWPDEIMWRVFAYDEARKLVARGEAIAKR